MFQGYAVFAQQEADFQWGDSYYFQLNVGESITFLDNEIELLKIQNHCNTIRVGKDTLTLKVSRRSLPKIAGGIRIFVANNKNIKSLSANKEVHGLLKKEAMIEFISSQTIEQSSSQSLPMHRWCGWWLC